MEDKKFERLPKWAKMRINLLEGNVEYWKNIAKSIENGTSNVVMLQGLDELSLPPKAHIRFYLPTKEKRVHIDIRHVEPNVLNINSSDTLKITPRASNSADVEVDRRG